jgi:exodeoxyribonuclease V gamma subunit
VRGKWVSESGQGVGERDYAPGYAQLLEGDLIFGDPDTDPDSRALHALLQDAQQINALIQLDGVDAPGVDASTEVA